jgi:hypothetical protein
MGTKNIFPDTDWQTPKPDDEDNLWRYIDFTQLVSILENDALWFPRVSCFFDPYEGALPEAEIREIVNGI